MCVCVQSLQRQTDSLFLLDYIHRHVASALGVSRELAGQRAEVQINRERRAVNHRWVSPGGRARQGERTFCTLLCLQCGFCKVVGGGERISAEAPKCCPLWFWRQGLL